MKSCPQCHLLLERAQVEGIDADACTVCGGCWFPGGSLSGAAESNVAGLAELDRVYPGNGAESSYAGLSMRCPDCRTVDLLEDALTSTPELSAPMCPQCGGVWLAAGRRAAAAKPVPPPLETAKTESAQIAPAPPVPLPSTASQSTDVDYLRANEEFARGFKYGSMGREPARKLVIVTCMDARISAFEMLGLQLGDAQVIRNAGGIITEDVLRSLVISHHVIGTTECLIINHTDCGMLEVNDAELRERLTEQTDMAPIAPQHFHGFTDLVKNVQHQMKRVTSHPWIPREMGVRGFVYDVSTGRLMEVLPLEKRDKEKA
jgi:carbonic anhydrase